MSGDVSTGTARCGSTAKLADARTANLQCGLAMYA
jgi:hypothetical protein